MAGFALGQKCALGLLGNQGECERFKWKWRCQGIQSRLWTLGVGKVWGLQASRPLPRTGTEQPVAVGSRKDTRSLIGVITFSSWWLKVNPGVGMGWHIGATPAAPLPRQVGMLLAVSPPRSREWDEALGGSLPSTMAKERLESGIPEEKGDAEWVLKDE